MTDQALPLEEQSSEGDWRRTHPLGLVARSLSNLGRAVVPIIAVVVGGRELFDNIGILMVVILAGLALNGVVVWLGWRHYRYRIGEDDIRVERGLISRSARSVPYERIQDVALEESPAARLLGLVEVRFETGAGGKDEVTLAYVDRAEGRRLRETVRARQAGATGVLHTGGIASDAEGGPAPAAAAEPPSRTLFAMNLSRLLTFGLFEFSLVVFAALFGAAQQFEFLLPFDPWEAEFWQEHTDLPAQLFGGLGIAVQAVAAALGVLTLVLVGLLTGIVRTVLRDYGFRLEETPQGLRRRRGLLTRTDVVMPLHRVQALAVTTGIVRRRLGPNGGWHGLDLVSLATDAKASSHTIVPFATLDEIAPVAAITGFALPDAETRWRLPSRRHRSDRALLVGIPLALVALIVAVGGQVLSVELALLQGAGVAVLAALLALRQLFLWRYDRHALDERHIHVRRGWLAPRIDVASRVKLQSVEIRQGPLAQRRGYADLVFGVAGGTLTIDGLELDEARAIRRAVLASIAEVDFSQLPGQRKGPGGAGALNAEVTGDQ